MPLLSGQQTTPGPGPSPGRERLKPKRLVWTDWRGNRFDLTGDISGYSSQVGRAGFGLVEREVIADRSVSGAAIVKNIRVTPRVLAVPLRIDGATVEEYLATLRALQASMRHPTDPDTGYPRPGTVTVELPDGTERSIPAYYQGGLSGTEDALDDLYALSSVFPSLEFYCPVPEWEGATQERVWPVVVQPTPFYPLYPLRLGSSQILASAAVDNFGDTDAFPIWEFTGPGTPVCGNADTGEQFSFTDPIPAGTTVVVDCRPHDVAPLTGLTVYDKATGEDWWPHLDDIALWPLPPERTNLTLSMAGATADSLIRLTWVLRYQAGW